MHGDAIQLDAPDSGAHEDLVWPTELEAGSKRVDTEGVVKRAYVVAGTRGGSPRIFG